MANSVAHFFSSPLNISLRSWSCKASADESAYNLMGLPLYVINCFSLAPFKILFMFNFVILIIICHEVFLFGFIFFGTLCASCILMSVSFPRVGKFLVIIFSENFSVSSLFSSERYNMNITHLMLSQNSFNSSLKNCSDWVPFTLPSYKLLICSILSSVLLIPSHYFLFQLLNSSFVIIFLYFLTLMTFSLSSSFVFLRLINMLITIFKKLFYQVNYLPHFIRGFSILSFHSFVWNISPLSSHLVSPMILASVIGEIATSPWWLR